MTTLVHNLGLSKTLAFHDVYSIDDVDLLAFVPRPAHALLLIFPVNTLYEEGRRKEDGGKEEYEGFGDDEPVVWFKQTIRNACGLIGLLHGVANGKASELIEQDSPLANLLQEAKVLPPKERADLLYQSKELETAHEEAARAGDTVAPSADDEVDLHYVCFVRSTADGRLWELDGRRKGPLDRGVLAEDEDVLSEKALAMTVRPFLSRERDNGVVGDGEMRFSLIVLSPALD